MRPVTKRRREGGFTLIELLVTLAVSMFGLMGLLAMNTTFSRGTTSAAETQEAVTIGQRTMEELRSKRTDDLATALTGSATSTPPMSRTSYAAVAGRTGLTYTVDVSVVAVTSTLWRLRTVVSWTETADGRTRQLALELLRPSREAL